MMVIELSQKRQPNRINPCLNSLNLPFVSKGLKKELTWLNQRNKIQTDLKNKIKD